MGGEGSTEGSYQKDARYARRLGPIEEKVHQISSTGHEIGRAMLPALTRLGPVAARNRSGALGQHKHSRTGDRTTSSWPARHSESF